MLTFAVAAQAISVNDNKNSTQEDQFTAHLSYRVNLTDRGMLKYTQIALTEA
jgi:hypothetical protein